MGKHRLEPGQLPKGFDWPDKYPEEWEQLRTKQPGDVRDAVTSYANDPKTLQRVLDGLRAKL